ncbi:MAG: GGDEF domain-containing protein [Actinomycetota bacterium]|nr:GGDEF domain-containing protein [Actinomycetota bacterium]
MNRDLPAHVDAPELISHRYHLIRVVVTLSTVGLVTLVIGLAALVDPENLHPLRYFGGCVVVAVVCGLAVLYLVKGGGTSTTAVEATMLAGLFSTFGNTIYGGLLEVDPWWQVCGYLVVILIAGGVSLRRWSTFCLFTGVGLGAWAIAIGGADESSEFLFDSFVLILLGAVVAAAILWLFRIERKRVTALNRELQENAMHDPLTGVLNRHGLLSATLAADGADSQAWGAYVDVDYFKTINDLRGHDHGDEVLRAAAGALAEAGGEFTARWGGDEFVTLGFGTPPDETSIQERVERGIREVEPDAAVTVGLATGSVRDGKDLDRLMRFADRKMYERRAEVRGEFPDRVSGHEPDPA